MGRWDDGKGGLAHREGIRQEHRGGEAGTARPATKPVLGSATHREEKWSRSNFSWGTFRCKLPNATLVVSSGFDQPSTIALASNRNLDVAAPIVEGLPTTHPECAGRERDSGLQRVIWLPAHEQPKPVSQRVLSYLPRDKTGTVFSCDPLTFSEGSHSELRVPYQLAPGAAIR